MFHTPLKQAQKSRQESSNPFTLKKKKKSGESRNICINIAQILPTVEFDNPICHNQSLSGQK